MTFSINRVSRRERLFVFALFPSISWPLSAQMNREPGPTSLDQPQLPARQPEQDVRSSSFSYGLKSNVLSNIDTLAQSISCLAPTATPAILIPLVFASAGNGTWLAYVIATIGLLFVGMNINQFASRSASPGSIYSYVAIGLGPGMGMLTGWLLLSAYLVVLSCVETQFAFYAMPVLEQTLKFTCHPLALILSCAALASYVAWRDIKISASVLLALEVCSISLMLVLVAVTFWHTPSLIDWKQISLEGVSPRSISMGLVLAIFGFTGFESAASLGAEAKNPLKNIPRAIINSCLWSGMFYVVCAYAMILGFRGSGNTLDKCGTPLIALSEIDGVPFLGLLLSIGAVISFFGCTIACINTASRLMFLMGHHGLFHSSFTSTHENNRTPHVAVIATTVLGLVPALILLQCRFSLMDIIGSTGTISACSFVLAYALISIAAPAYLFQLRNLRVYDLSIAVLAVSAMSLALFGTLAQSGDGLARYLPSIFVSLVLAGIAWYVILKMFFPQSIQSMTEDMKTIRSRFLEGETTTPKC